MFRRILIISRIIICAASIFLFVIKISYAVDIRYKIRITTTNAAQALRALADQTDTPLIFPFDIVEVMKTKRIVGRFTLKDVLSHLLADTNLTCFRSQAGIIVIRETVPVHDEENAEQKCFSVQKTPDLPTMKKDAWDDGSEYHLLDEIVTTALRREADLQDTPISVSTIPGEILERISSPELSRVAAIAPNISFSSAGPVSGSSSVAVIYIRGIGQSDYTPVTDPGVGIYVDGVYYGRTVGSALDLMDIKSVEIVRGPQGTLFGRNTIGGAVAINTNDPEDKIGGRGRLIGGSYNRKELFLTLHLPLSDKIKTSFNIMRRKRDGYVERISLPDAAALGDDNVLNTRFKMLWQVNDRLELRLTADYLREREESAPEVNLFVRDDRDIPRAWNAGLGISTASGCIEGRPDVGVNCFNSRLNTGPFETRETSLSRNTVDAWGGSLSGEYSLNDAITSKLILSYREIKTQFARQVDGTALNLFENREFYEQNQLGFDFRLEGSEAMFDWTSGIFFFKEKANNQLDFGGVLNTILWPIHYGGTVENSNYALYGEAVYHFSNRLHFTAGLRFTDETKQANPNAFSYINGDINKPPQAGDPGTKLLIEPGKRINSFSYITWRTIAAYDVSDEISAYTSIATGFKSGGFEWRITTDFIDKDLPEFAPENVITYEMGIKSYFRGMGLRLNVSGFYSDYNNIQVATNLPNSIATQQQNAAKAGLYGFEAEAIWQFNDAILLGASIGHINAAFKSFDPLANLPLTLDDKFVLTPSWTLGWGASVRVWKISTGSLSIQIDGSYKSSYQLEAANSDFVFEDGYAVMNASLYYKNRDKNWSASFGVNNLSNEIYIIGGDANSTIGYENAIFARPRNWYLEVGFDW